MQSIAQILPPLRQDEPKRESMSDSRRTAWIANRISRLISAYRRDDYADPESFIAQAGVVLEGYSDDVIEHVTSPASGIQRTQKFAPTIAEIVAACEAQVAAIFRQKELDKWAERKRRTAEEKARIGSVAPVSKPNLFVPEGSRNYDKMALRANAEPARAYFETRTCTDGVRRSGVCVPLSWWEESSQRSA